MNNSYNQDELATCSVCGKTLHETNINMIDYDIDVCLDCEESIKDTVNTPSLADVLKTLDIELLDKSNIPMDCETSVFNTVERFSEHVTMLRDLDRDKLFNIKIYGCYAQSDFEFTLYYRVKVNFTK